MQPNSALEGQISEQGSNKRRRRQEIKIEPVIWESERVAKVQVLTVSHPRPGSESLLELVLEPDPEELDSSSLSSELLLLLALRREDLGSRAEPRSSPPPVWEEEHEVESHRSTNITDKQSTQGLPPSTKTEIQLMSQRQWVLHASKIQQGRKPFWEFDFFPKTWSTMENMTQAYCVELFTHLWILIFALICHLTFHWRPAHKKERGDNHACHTVNHCSNHIVLPEGKLLPIV